MFTPINRVALKEEAKARLADKWGSAWLVALIYIFTTALSSITHTETQRLYDNYDVTVATTTPFSSLFSLFVASVVFIGVAGYFLNIANGRPFGLDDVKKPFYNYGTMLLATLWEKLFIFLWSMLFVVPGIIKAIAYSMTPFILFDNPGVGYREAIKISMVLTDGRKGELFGVFMSFFGWYLLTGITFGIAGIYVIPYCQTTFAEVYEQYKADAVSQGRISADVFYPQNSVM